ncbi:MAG: putative integral membrane protein [Candidatus Omnitrophota bacterium]|jgi:uncharacterized integral membrane protein
MKTWTWLKLFFYLIFWALVAMFFAQNWRPTVIQFPFGPPYHVSMSAVLIIALFLGACIGALLYRKFDHIMDHGHDDHDDHDDHDEDDLIEEESHHH